MWLFLVYRTLSITKAHASQRELSVPYRIGMTFYKSTVICRNMVIEILKKERKQLHFPAIIATTKNNQ